MKKNSFCTLLLFLLAYIISIVSANAESAFKDPKTMHTKDRDFKYERMVGKGIKHIYEYRAKEPFQINVLEIDLYTSQMRIEAEKGQDQLFKGEKVASVAERENKDEHIVVGAVNADFWGGKYLPIGFLVDDGTIYRFPHKTRPCFMMDEEGNPYIEYETLKLKFKTEEISIDIDAINSESGKEDVILYSPRGYEKTPESSERVEIIINQSSNRFIPNEKCQIEIKEIKQKSTGGTPLAEGQFVLSMIPSKAEPAANLKAGDLAYLDPKLTNVQKGIITAVGGTPLLIKNKEVKIDYEKEEMAKNFCTDKHPRTAVGFNLEKKKLWLFVVDGRQPATSVGMDLYEVTQYFQDLGATDAMNLDGGGSSTMWVRGNVVNSPSDATGPRTVTDSLLVTLLVKKGELNSIAIDPENALFPTGAKLKFNAFGFDKNYNPVDPKDAKLKWSLSDSVKGSIDKDGFFQAEAPSEGKVFVKYVADTEKKFSTKISIKDVAAIKTSIDKVVVEKGEIKNVAVNLFGENDTPLYFSQDAIKAESNSRAFEFHFENNTLKVMGMSKGKGELKLMSGNVEKKLTVLVDYLTTKSVMNFDSDKFDGQAIALTGVKYNETKTSIVPEKENKKEGDGCLRLNYAMAPGGTTAIYLNMNVPVPGEPTKLWLQVYGDAGKGWVRGEIEDKDGEKFLLDFTEGGKGIQWKDEWRTLEMDVEDIKPKWDNPGAKLTFPITIKSLYLAQGKEADKGSGSILIDNLFVTVPEE